MTSSEKDFASGIVYEIYVINNIMLSTYEIRLINMFFKNRMHAC